MAEIVPPFPYFTDLAGHALEDGYVYIGTVGQDARANPITTYWDSSLTQTAAQPLRTALGYIMYQGAPSNIFVNASSYSIKVLDKHQRLVFEDRYNYPPVASSDLSGSTGSALVGYIQVGNAAVARTALSKMRDIQSALDYGIANDDTNQAAEISAMYADADVYAPFFPSGDYRITSNVTISKPTRFDKGAVINIASGATLTIGADILAGHYQVFNVESGGSITITSGALSQIIPAWFGSNVWYGGSNTVYGNKTGEKLLKSTGPTTANYITAFGFRCAQVMDTGLEGAFYGTFAGSSLTDGTFNTALGYAAMRGEESPVGSGTFLAMSGRSNTAVGQGTIQNATTANRNTAVGAGAILANDTPTDVVAVGTSALRIGKVGKENVFVGSSCGYSYGTTGIDTDNYRTVAIGYNAMGSATEGEFNTVVGAMSGFYLTTGTQNTFLGYNTGPLNGTYATVSSSICIGLNARTQVNNSITIANSITETVAGRIRIGASASQTSTLLGPKTLTIGDSGGASIIVGTGTPEGAVTAGVGSLFLRTDGGGGTTLYVKESGSGNTGWAGK